MFLTACILYYIWSWPSILRSESGELATPSLDAPLQDIVAWDDQGREGNFTAQGIFALEPFFSAASEAGLYVIARPGPYINAESSGGGYPGWLNQRNATTRTPDYLPYTANYVAQIAAIIARAQITNGGPVIVLQPENEYSYPTSTVQFPNREYFAAVQEQYKEAGMVVPLISNDGGPYGLFAPGTGLGAADIYGHDDYPLGFDCGSLSLWANNSLPTQYKRLHQLQSPSTPFSIMELQAGAFDPWGGSTFNNCAQLLNEEFERVFYKNNYAAGIKILNLYMVTSNVGRTLYHTDAYNYWVLDLSEFAPFNNFTTASATSIIARLSFQVTGESIRPGYLLRTASYNYHRGLFITGDLNETSFLEIIGGIPRVCNRLTFNGSTVSLHRSSEGILKGFVPYFPPKFSMPVISDLNWKYIDGLPEILPSYNDSSWPRANLTHSNNTVRQLTTPTSLYGSDYGFHTSNLLFRGRFMAAGIEKTLQLDTQGGTAYAASVFLNQTSLGSFPGTSAQAVSNLTSRSPPSPQAKNASSPSSSTQWASTKTSSSAATRTRTPAASSTTPFPAAPSPPSAGKSPATSAAKTTATARAGPLHIPTDYAGTPVHYDIPMSFVFTNSTMAAKRPGIARSYGVPCAGGDCELRRDELRGGVAVGDGGLRGGSGDPAGGYGGDSDWVWEGGDGAGAAVGEAGGGLLIGDGVG
ncbi:hypothetical protein MMC13_002165 [Lambiella insularis]|nr:hypothetical protein [Lambiella insularis]